MFTDETGILPASGCCEIEILTRPANFYSEVGDQPDLEKGILLNGKLLLPFKDDNGTRHKFLDEEAGLLLKAELWGTQGANEWKRWRFLQPEHEEFFQPIFDYQRIETPYWWKYNGPAKEQDAWVDVVVVPFIKFDPFFRPDLELALRDKADELAALYNVTDWSYEQYKPVKGGTSFVIHDYGGGRTFES